VWNAARSYRIRPWRITTRFFVQGCLLDPKNHIIGATTGASIMPTVNAIGSVMARRPVSIHPRSRRGGVGATNWASTRAGAVYAGMLVAASLATG
jgi:hypothetical protein